MNVLCEESEHQETRGGKPATLLLKQELLEFHRVPSGAVVEWELSTFSRKALTVSAAEAWGDWSRGSQMKFLEPTKGVGMRKLFSRAGYEVVLVDEFRTSCTCFGCEGGACEKFRSVTNPRSWMRETYGPATRAAQVPKLQAVVEQGPQRVAQHHAVRPGGETGRPEAILHDQKLQ
ncbi:hypothetical protein BASA81_007771 [Batrachochytrium salamandrivorans]|nr:hypothetical protein BASA81_007771 [Batrachochytrium salamandrivorans]